MLGSRGVTTDQYLDLSQTELIAVMVDKEMVRERRDTSERESLFVVLSQKLKESCDSAQSLTMELEQMRADHDSEMTCERPSLIIQIKIIDCAVVVRDDLTSRENELEDMENREIERDKAVEKLECVVSKLKEDRTHYRSLAENNQ